MLLALYHFCQGLCRCIALAIITPKISHATSSYSTLMPDGPFFATKSGVINLTPDDFDEHHLWQLKSKKCTAILFYATWCPYCVAVKDAWQQLGKTAKFMDITAFQSDAYPEHVQGIREEKPDLVKSYPTMIIYKKGQPVTKFGETKRSYGDLLNACMKACQSS